jgi:CDP-6-deoxy-D-xylo-4-hexulose-3-dehydrase
MEGGCVVTDDEELYHILLCMRAHGWTRNLPKENLVSGTKSDDIFEESFKFVLPGYNVRPIEMSGAIGIEQLKKLPDFINKRRENGTYFQTLFANHPYLNIQQETGNSSWFGFSFVIKEDAEIERKEIVSKLTANGIECRPIVTGNFAKNDVLQYFDYDISGSLKNAEYIDTNGFFVGNHQLGLKKEIIFLAKVLAA